MEATKICAPNLTIFTKMRSDAHRALGRSLKRCQRCIRAASKNTKPAAGDDDDEEEETENTAGDGNDDDERSADLHRRKAELSALSQKT